MFYMIHLYLTSLHSYQGHGLQSLGLGREWRPACISRTVVSPWNLCRIDVGEGCAQVESGARGEDGEFDGGSR